VENRNGLGIGEGVRNSCALDLIAQKETMGGQGWSAILTCCQGDHVRFVCSDQNEKMSPRE
jgi:hypothetical protein